MHFTHAILAVTACLSTALAAPQGAGATCFDAGDCIFNGGGQCVKTSPQQILGTCAPKGSPTATSSAPAGSATGAICFDAGDCFLSGGGMCIKKAGSITGNCSK